MIKIKATSAYYIKLGAGGSKEKECIEENHTLWVNYSEIPHSLCQKGEWEQVKSLFIQKGSDPGSATRHTNQVRAFYEKEQDVLWITFYQNRLWYCFANATVTQLNDQSIIRKTLNGWKSTDIQGIPLEIERLSGKLLSIQGFKGTICTIKGPVFDYLIRKINCETSPTEQSALDAQKALTQALEQIIPHLHWKEFELLIDLIFRQAGWQRISQLGEVQKTFDLALLSPITQERYLVQIKSQANRKQFEQFRDDTSAITNYTRYYFVVHSPHDDLSNKIEIETATHKLWLISDIASLVMQYGLIDWVIKKAV